MSVPKLRFKEFDGDWDFRKIGDISDSIVPGRNKPKLFDGDIPWVTTPDIKDKIYVSDTQSNYYISEVEAKNVGSKIVPTNSVIMSCVGDLGLFAINTKPIVINQQLHAFLLDNSKYSSVFVLNALSKNQNFIEKVATKTALPYLNKDNCNSIPLFLCSFEEQTEIASFLSAVNEKISQLNQKHELLSQYKQGMMQKLFSQQIHFKADNGSEFREWEKTNFLDLMIDLWDYRGKTPKKLGMEWGDGEIPSLSALNIKKGFIDFEAECHLGSEKLYKTWMNKGDLEKGDIIFTMEAPLGNVALIPDDRKYILSQRVVCFKTNKEMVINKFLFQLILSDLFQNCIEELATGTTAKGINQKSMKKIKVSLPSKEEQTKIANFLSAIDQKIEIVAKQVEQAKQWKKGLLQQMFV